MAGDSKGDKEMQVLRVLTRTLIKGTTNRSEDANITITKAWLYAALELPEVSHYEAITYAFMKIIANKTNALDNKDHQALVRQCATRFSKYSKQNIDALVKYYSDTEFTD